MPRASVSCVRMIMVQAVQSYAKNCISMPPWLQPQSGRDDEYPHGSATTPWGDNHNHAIDKRSAFKVSQPYPGDHLRPCMKLLCVTSQGDQ